MNEPDDEPLTEDQIRAEVEKVASDPDFACEDQDFLGSLRIVVAAIFLGTNADKLARFLGLNRDKFVRPRAKRLRENGIFEQGAIGQSGKVGIEASVLEGDDDGKLRVWLTVTALIAEGFIIRHEGP